MTLEEVRILAPHDARIARLEAELANARARREDAVELLQTGKLRRLRLDAALEAGRDAETIKARQAAQRAAKDGKYLRL